MHLKSLDLNLLVVLDALLELRSVSTTAERLGLSPSATSHALGRLRVALADPLLVRGSGGLVATARAEALAEPVRAALRTIGDAIDGPQAFEPATAQRTFTIVTTDYGELVILPTLMRELASHAPGLDIVIRPAGRDVATQLSSAHGDLALVPNVEPYQAAGIRVRTLFDEEFVCLLRRDHPAAKKRWTVKRFAALDHALIAPRGQPGGVVETALELEGLRRRVGLRLTNFLSAPFVIAGSDMVLTAPKRVAVAFASSLPLTMLPPPLPLPGFSMVLAWHDRVHHDPAHAWLRERVATVAKRTAPRTRPRRRPSAKRRA